MRFMRHTWRLTLTLTLTLTAYIGEVHEAHAGHLKQLRGEYEARFEAKVAHVV